jgi:deoxycytidylate deaminase
MKDKKTFYDPTFIPNKERYFMSIAKQIATGSNHPIASGGCVIVRDKEIIGDGRSVLAECKVEVDCLTYAIATACKRGTPTAGATVYTTRYPFSASVFQLFLMGIKKIVVLAHEWEPYYKDEFRRAARLARELLISIEPLFEDEDQRFTTNNQDREEEFKDKDLYTFSPAETDGISPEKYDEQHNDSDHITL